jgi:cation transport ATPase
MGVGGKGIAVLFALSVGALVSGGIARLAGARQVADGCWIAGTVMAIVPASVWVLAGLRRGRFGVDLIAVLSLIGTLLVGEYLAGALIAVMLAGGRALDAAAERRASHDLRALLEHAPRFARRRVGSAVSTIALNEVAIDDLLVVGPGEVVPVDGRIASAAAVLDESVLTGEPLQVERGVGEPVRSGVVNAGGALEMRATATAEDSCHWPCWWPAGRGWPAGRRCGPWRCWWWRHPAHCCSPPRWRSCRDCRAPRAGEWWSAAEPRWRTSATQRLW